MKAIIPSLSAYRNKVGAFAAAGTLSRQLSTSAGTHTLTLPSAKGQRKEFTVVSTSGTATVAVVAPDTLVGLATVAANTSGTFSSRESRWYRVS